jgi:pyruvyl transferase EpsO
LDATLKQYSALACRSAIGDGPVFFLGGGNLGNLYEKHNRQRLAALGEIPDNPAVFLPFSIANSPGRSKGWNEIAAAFSGHGKVRLVSREEKTRHELLNRHGFSSVLCPDLAHCLSPAAANRAGEPLRLLRKDGERQPGRQDGDGLDWRDLPYMKRTNRVGKLAAVCPPGRARLWVYDTLAARKAGIAMKAIGASRHLTTDRLHGMILASLLGVPAEVFDNTTGKVSSYFTTWRRGLEGVELKRQDQATSPELPG